jgi:rhodanese-related sulfurtransferase
VGWQRFLLLTTLGSVLWVGAGLGAGMVFKAQINVLLAHLQRIGSAAATGFGLLLAGYIAFKWWERRRFYAQLRMARITVTDLYELIEAGQKPIILDVRTHTARSLEPCWIPSAIHSPIEEIANRIEELPHDREIIVYCTCPNEASAAQIAKQLMNHGFLKVRPLHGGLEAWIAAGYAVDTPSPGPQSKPNDSLAAAS